MHDTDFLSIKEFASLVGVHPDTIRRSIRKKRIHALRINGGQRAMFRIPKSEINRLALVDLEVLIQQEVEKRLKEIPKLL